MTDPMKTLTYFSVDYRSPPSGIGQIIRPGVVEAREIILLTSKGNGDFANPFYKATHHFPHQMYEDPSIDKDAYEWMSDLFKGYGVTHVYDAELNYQWGMSQHLGVNYYPVSIWLDIVYNGKPKDSLFS